MSTEFYADYISKTTFDPESHSVRSKQLDEAATDQKKKPASKTPKMEVPPSVVPEEYGEGEKSHITSHVEKKYGGRGGPGGSGALHVGSHGDHHAYNVETEEHTDTHNSYAIHNEKTGQTHEVKIPGKVQTASQVHKHIEPHGGSSTLAKHIANDHNSMHESNNLSEKDTHKTKDGRTAKKGLWYNIHQKRKRGEAPAKPGDPDRPSAADLKRSQESVAQEELVGKQYKLDHNKDNKIDKADMKMVRRKGAVDELSSDTLRSYRNKISRGGVDAVSKDKDGNFSMRKHDNRYSGEYLAHNKLAKSGHLGATSKQAFKNKAKVGTTDKVDDNLRKVDEKKKSLASLRNTSMLDGRDRLAKMTQPQKPKIKPLKTTYTAEGTFKVNVEGLPTMYIDGASAGEVKQALKKKFKDPKSVGEIERISPAEKKKELRAKVAEEEQVNEISGKKLAAYSQKANTDMYGRALRKGMDMERGSSSMGRAKVVDKDNDRKIKNRSAGIAKANMRMAGKMAKHNEDTEKIDKMQEGIKDAVAKVKSVGASMISNYKKSRNIASPGKGRNVLKGESVGEDIGDAVAKNKSLGTKTSTSAGGVTTSVNKSANRVTTTSDAGTTTKDMSGVTRSQTTPRVGGFQATQTYRPDSTPGYQSASMKSGTTTTSIKGSPETGYKGSNKFSAGAVNVKQNQSGKRSGSYTMGEDTYDAKHPLRKHLKKVGKGGEVEYSHQGKTHKGRYGGLMNRGGRSYAKVHHDTHMAMVPMPQVKYPD